MRDQFFGKTFFWSLAITFGLFVLAIISSLCSAAFPILLLLGVIVAVACAKHPLFGLLAVFLELLSNPHGHLISTDSPIPFSLRMAVFVGFFVGYGLYLLRTKTVPSLNRLSLILLLPLAAAILIGFVRGAALGDLTFAFQDGNAYFYLLYAVPILSTRWHPSQKRQFLQVFSAGAVWNILLSLGILYVFTHFGEDILRSMYLFLRDRRLAEITNVGGGVYRVFMQSQFFVMGFGAVLIPFFLQRHPIKNSRLSVVLLSGVIATMLLSLSRSFWVGTAVAFLALLFLLIRHRYGLRAWKSFVIHAACSILGAVALIVTVTLFPFPSQRVDGGDLAEALRLRTEADVAISSRWMLLEPMRQAIMEHPILGNGFGSTVSFVTDDPRVREIHPDGVWTTSAMEWGWLELWLKMGIMGPLAFLFLFVMIVRQFFLQKKSDTSWMGIGLIAGLVFLYATHAFSPYLNHPIGLGFILFTLLFLPDARLSPEDPVKTQEALYNPQGTRLPASVLSPQVE